MRSFFITLALIGLFGRAVSQETEVSIFLYAPELPDSSSVFITGSLPQLGNWHPSAVKMEAVGGHRWGKQISVNAVRSIEYKYTLGSWEREAAGADGAPLRNFAVTISGHLSIHDTVFHWKSSLAKRNNGQVTGTVKYHRALRTSGLPERDVVVWLPPGYDPASSRRYPVLYMQDGQNVFDPATSAFGQDWKIDESADSMIRKGVIGPLIIVGVYNTIDRNSEYIPSEKGSRYRQFLATELKPFIDSAYKTKKGRKYNWVGGSSAGGILAFMTVWEYPQLFSKAICMSPAFRLPGNAESGWNYVKTVTAEPKRKQVFFYIDNGGVGLEQRLQPGIDEMLTALNNKGYRKGKDFIYVPEPGASHNEQAWAARFPGALKQVMGRR